MIHRSKFVSQRSRQAGGDAETSTSTWLCEINSIVKSLFKIYTSGEGKSPKNNSAAAKIAKNQIGAKKKKFAKSSDRETFFREFCEVSDDARPNGRRHQLARQILL